MLRYIEITNIALIDRASMDFGPGLCVLTGETGAGKSIIIDSINAVLGARAARDIVRKGSDGAAVTAVFAFDGNDFYDRLRPVLNENGISADADGELVLAREISASGRNLCRVNGKIVASQALKTIGEFIVDLHGQHENHSLMKREKHIEMIDNFGGPKLLARREAYSGLYDEYWRVKRRIAELLKSESERVRAMDILTFQINEIKTVKPQPNEDERLRAQIETLANAEKINGALASACALLNGGGNGDGGSGGGDQYGVQNSASALVSIVEAIRTLSQITQYSGDFTEISSRLSEARYIIEDAAVALRNKLDAEEPDPRRLDVLNERLEAVERLKRKYGGSIKNIHSFYKQSVSELNKLINSEQTIKDLEKRLSEVKIDMLEYAAELTDLRRKTAADIEEGVVGELADLEMNNGRFKVAFDTTENIDEYNAKGRDQLEFLFCANPGEELKPLVRIASGGEMSRVMLAIKSVLAGADNIPTMIFDEIDAGISGKAATRVAEKMHLLSKGRQIICVTHLAQIACMADEQFLIEKTSTDIETQTKIHKLEFAFRTGEISRMLGGGAPTDASMRLSGELLDRAEQFKNAAASR